MRRADWNSKLLEDIEKSYQSQTMRPVCVCVCVCVSVVQCACSSVRRWRPTVVAVVAPTPSTNVAGMLRIIAAVPSMSVPVRRGCRLTTSAPTPPYFLYAVPAHCVHAGNCIVYMFVALYDFYPHDAMLAWVLAMALCLSVCLS